MLATVPACLVTGDPEFEGPKRTRPLLLPSPLLPTTQVVLVRAENNAFAAKSFEALVISEDVGTPVSTVLLMDFGIPVGPGEEPFIFPNQGPAVEPSTFAAGPRKASAKLEKNVIEALALISVGCHTATLAVSHGFTTDDGVAFCPIEPGDISRLTWFVSICDSSKSPGEPGECPLDNCPVNDGEAQDLEEDFCERGQGGAAP